MPDIHFHALGATRARSGEDPLVPFLLSARQGPVTVSARDVHRLDSHRLQLLLVAERQWQIDGKDFKLTDMSPSFRDGLERLGIASDHFDKETLQ
jgi:anti-anti-sigma regulatory factor